MKKKLIIITSNSLRHRFFAHQLCRIFDVKKVYVEGNIQQVCYINILPKNLKLFCYPYGYKMSYNKTTLKILDKFNFDFAFIFDNKMNLNYKKFELSRIDCNKF